MCSDGCSVQFERAFKNNKEFLDIFESSHKGTHPVPWSVWRKEKGKKIDDKRTLFLNRFSVVCFPKPLKNFVLCIISGKQRFLHIYVTVAKILFMY